MYLYYYFFIYFYIQLQLFQLQNALSVYHLTMLSMPSFSARSSLKMLIKQAHITKERQVLRHIVTQSLIVR